MKVIREVTFQEILVYLDTLGLYDKADTIRSLSSFQQYYVVLLSEDEFFNLLFLSNYEVESIAPPNDRVLGAVSKRARMSNHRRLSGNWDLDDIIFKTNQFLNAHSIKDLPPLVLRDLRIGEEGDGKYIHDGCHRALGIAMAIRSGQLPYEPVSAYLATNTMLHVENANNRTGER